MTKRPLKLRFRIPPYEPSDRNEWRRQIHAAALAKRAKVKYEPTDKLEVEVGLYFKVGALTWHVSTTDSRAYSTHYRLAPVDRRRSTISSR